MYSGDGHTLWLNSRALEALGVTRDSEPPVGGSYDKDANGELTGIAHEAAAMQLLPRCLEWLGEDRIASAYADQMKRMAEQGITSICDMSLMPMPGCDFIRDDVYDKLQASGKLGIRAHLFPTLLDDQSRLEDSRPATRTTRCSRRQALNSSSTACRASIPHTSLSPIPTRASRATRAA